ncbi:hypothetical protein E4U51_001013 [Claviceps purpurea]|nr:hypothetical protein E4U51_001013 [Claviceps purpurea]
MAHVAQSCHHPLSGLGSINVEAVGTEAIAARERVPKLLTAEYDKIACLVTPSALEGVWEVCLSIFNIGTTNPQRHAQNSNTITADNLEKSIEKAVQKALRASPTGGNTSTRPTVLSTPGSYTIRRFLKPNPSMRRYALDSVTTVTNSGTSPHSTTPPLSVDAAPPQNTKQNRHVRHFTEPLGRSAQTVREPTQRGPDSAPSPIHNGRKQGRPIQADRGNSPTPGMTTTRSPKEGDLPETTSPPKRPRGSAADSYSTDPPPPLGQPPRRLTPNPPPNDTSPILEY